MRQVTGFPNVLTRVTAVLRGRRCAQTDVTDNCNGTYALQFRLPLAGHWQLSASIAGEEVPWPQAASLKAVHPPLTAAECEISGVDGIVSCGTSDPIFIQVCACVLAAAVLYCQCHALDCLIVSRHVTPTSMSERAILPLFFTAARCF